MKTHHDDLLEMLGHEGRGQDPPEDPRWEALAMGTLSDEEAEALRAEAEGTEEGRRKYELYRPLDAAATEASLARLLATIPGRFDPSEVEPPRDAAPGVSALPADPSPLRLLATKSAASTAAGATVGPAAGGAASTPGARAARRFMSRGPVVTAALAIAAGLALWVARPKPRELPAFAMRTDGGEKVQRAAPGPDSTSLRLTDPKSHGKVTLTPPVPLSGELPQVHTLLLHDGKPWKKDACEPAVSSREIVIDCVRESLGSAFPAGKWAVLVAVGWTKELPSDEAELIAASGRAPSETLSRGFQVFTVPVDFGDSSHAALEVEIVGCNALRSAGDNPVCEIPKDRTIHLWIKASPPVTVTRTLDGKPAGTLVEAIQGGERFVIKDLPDDARALMIEASQGGVSSTLRWTLAPRTTHAALEKAGELRNDDKTRGEARRLLTPLLGDADPVIRAKATGMLARIERLDGRLATSIAQFREAISLDQKAGSISDEADDRLALSFTLCQNSTEHRPRCDEARKVLGEMDAVLARYPEGRALLPYYLGITDLDTGDVRAGLRHFEEAERGTARLGLFNEQSDARRERAKLLSLLGRQAEAIALFQQIEHSENFGSDRCGKAQFFNDYGFVALSIPGPELRAQLGAPDPTPLLERSLSLFKATCEGSSDIGHVLLNLANAAMDQGELTQARARLDELEKLGPDQHARIKLAQLKAVARLALLGGHHQEASKAYDQLAALAEEASFPVHRADAALGRASTLDTLGKGDEARKAYAEADAILDARSLQVPIGEGKQGFLARQERSTRLRLDFLLRQAEGARTPASSQDYLAEAATAARRSRARILSSLQSIDRLDRLPPEKRRAFEAAMDAYRSERAVFDDPRGTGKDRHAVEAKLDEALALAGVQGAAGSAPLPGPRKGEVILVYHPVVDGWAGLSLSEQGVTAHRLGPVDLQASPERLARQLLRPFEAVLSGAERLRFAPHGPLAGVDFHALPWKGEKGETLLASFPIVYGVDIQAGRPPSRDSRAPGSILVVDDPHGDLPQARREANEVALAFTERRFSVKRLSGPEATYEAVVAELPHADLFHYSGHGHFEGQRDGLESGLGLAGKQTLTAGDILALPGAPRQVILSGCETAKTAEGELPQGLGLGQAFVAAGAEVVVAATRKVDDALASRFMTALARRSAATPGDLVGDLRAVALEVAKESPSSDWGTFRVLVP